MSVLGLLNFQEKIITVPDKGFPSKNKLCISVCCQILSAFLYFSPSFKFGVRVRIRVRVRVKIRIMIRVVVMHIEHSIYTI